MLSRFGQVHLTSGALKPSPVLLAIGIPDPITHGSVRFSLNRLTGNNQLNMATPLVVESKNH